MGQENRLICITGPTASGKTALSIALAQRLQTEIISADSMQVYRGMDIGTAKPTLAERQGIPHHMLDILDPEEPFSVARFVEIADQHAQGIIQKGKVPIVAGGTALYMDALIAGNTFAGGETDLALREELQTLAEREGVTAVHDRLRAVDPDYAAQLHPNNLKRVIRALEVYCQTGMTLQALNLQNKRKAPKYNAVIIGVCPASREALYARIHHRIDVMLQNGLLQEAERLYQQGKLVGTAAQAIGYKELLAWLEGRDSLENCVELLKQRSRNYAKRQLTWLKKDDRIHWIYYNDLSDFSQALQDATEYIARIIVS